MDYRKFFDAVRGHYIRRFLQQCPSPEASIRYATYGILSPRCQSLLEQIRPVLTNKAKTFKPVGDSNVGSSPQAVHLCPFCHRGFLHH
jgi:hypothetical protein